MSEIWLLAPSPDGCGDLIEAVSGLTFGIRPDWDGYEAQHGSLSRIYAKEGDYTYDIIRWQPDSDEGVTVASGLTKAEAEAILRTMAEKVGTIDCRKFYEEQGEL